MTSRERMMIALRNGQPDRVPVAPDISNMVPCRLTGKPFWDIYVNSDPPLWRAYIDAVKFYGMDGWFTYGDIHFKSAQPVEIERHIVKKAPSKWEVRTTYHTPDGDLTELMVSPGGNAPTLVEKKIKNFKEDFKKIKHLFSDIVGYDDRVFQQQKRELDQYGIMCLSIGTPGLHVFVDLFDGSLAAATYAYYDYPDLFEELREMADKRCMQQLEIALDVGVDSILTGGSGSITLQSPEIWRHLSLPTLKKITKMCKEAGVISGIHSCGKERHMVEVCATETDLDYINPLEIPPMGDCALDECREKFGDRMALMGNLHTTEVMLKGRPEDVQRESLKAILAAGKGGGFVLSTGDQCGRDTPDENLFAMVDIAKRFGQYPLDIEAIEAEIGKMPVILKA